MPVILNALSLLVIVQCVTVLNIKLSVLLVRWPKQNTVLGAATKHRITAKISGNALKQWGRIHSAPRQRTSQLQKHQAARKSRRIRAKVCDWISGHPGW